MSADTGCTSYRTRLNLIVRLQALVMSAILLFKDSKRSGEQFKLLLQSLQAFKDNTLSGVVLRKASMTTSDLFAALSLKISDTAMPSELLKYLGKRGARYVGELYYLHFDPRGQGACERKEELMGFLSNSLGLPEALNPLESGWTPPYWQESGFTTLLRMSPLAYFGKSTVGRQCSFMRGTRRYSPRVATLARCLHTSGVHCMARYLSQEQPSRRHWGVGRMATLEKALSNGQGGPLWACVLIPENHKLRDEAPPEWLSEEKAMEAEYAEWKALRERQREASRKRMAEELAERDRRDTEMRRHISENFENTPVVLLDLSVRASNALEANGLDTIGKVLALGREGLANLSFGRVSIVEIFRKIDALASERSA